MLENMTDVQKMRLAFIAGWIAKDQSKSSDDLKIYHGADLEAEITLACFNKFLEDAPELAKQCLEEQYDKA
jgi:hypothetical protein